MNIKSIKKQYPNPVAAQEEATDTDYCVGGAYVLAHGGEDRFPFPHELTNMLQKQNPALPHLIARRLAGHTIRYSNAGEFARAWRYLEEADGWTPAPRTEV